VFSGPYLGNSRNICESRRQYSLTLSNPLPTRYVNLLAVSADYLIHSFLRPISRLCTATLVPSAREAFGYCSDPQWLMRADPGPIAAAQRG